MLEIKNLNITHQNNHIIKDFNLSTNENGFIVIEGKNGIGKTSILNAIAGIKASETNITGTISYNNQNINMLHKKDKAKIIGIVEQQYNPNFSFTVKEFLLQSRYPYKKLFSGLTTKDLKKIAYAIKITQIDKLKNKYLDKLSGGQLQLVKIAAIIAQEPEIYLLDEPINNLDSNNTKTILDIFKHLSKTKLVIVVLHNNSLSNKYADKIIKYLE